MQHTTCVVSLYTAAVWGMAHGKKNEEMSRNQLTGGNRCWNCQLSNIIIIIKNVSRKEEKSFASICSASFSEVCFPTLCFTKDLGLQNRGRRVSGGERSLGTTMMKGVKWVISSPVPLCAPKAATTACTVCSAPFSSALGDAINQVCFLPAVITHCFASPSWGAGEAELWAGGIFSAFGKSSRSDWPYRKVRRNSCVASEDCAGSLAGAPPLFFYPTVYPEAV